MKLRSPHLWIAVFSGLAVVSLALVDLERTSPGPLAAVHHLEPDLAEGRSCSSCHGSWSVSMADACLECHADVGEHIERGRGLHGLIGADQKNRKSEAMRCGKCHSDHHGTTAALVNRRSFALAGVDDPNAFEHERIGFSMGGAHLELSCAECHTHADEPILPKGERRYLGLDQRCIACHAQVYEESHPGGMRMACTTCHGQESFGELVTEGHERYLALVGGHGGLDCGRCHAGGSSHSLEAIGARGLGGGKGELAPRQCADCHDSPHDSGFLSKLTKLVNRSVPATCGECHAEEHTSFREPGLEISSRQHALTGFLLDDPHDAVACADCHAAEPDSFEARFPGRSAEACSACHADPHAGQFEAGPFGGQECTACHDANQFEQHAFTLKQHERTGLPLTGTHRDVDCSSCHSVPTEGHPRQFRGTSSRCADCHADAHLGYFDERSAKLEDLPHGECARCHDTVRFSELVPAGSGGFRHAPWTGFPIRGAHAQAACGICHERAAEPDDLGRRFGRVSELFGEFEGCSTCHTDPHRGKFDGPRRPPEVEGRTGCLRCHVESSFRAFPDGFDHRLWTGVALQGAHKKTDCVACHEPAMEPDDFGLFWGAARGRKCEDCHSDPHAGQFREQKQDEPGPGRTDCRRCHTTVNFHEVSFNHETDSRFPLGDPHGELACEACHESWDLSGGGAVVRYRPLSTACVDCHGVPEDQLRRRTRRKR